MANIVGDIAIQIGADIAPLITNLGKAQGSVITFGKAADSAASGPMRRMASVAGTLAGAAVSASLGLAALTKVAIDNIGALSDAAKATGLHVSQLQAMQQVAGEASVSSEALTKSIVKMQDTIANASRGAAAQVAAINNIGLSIQDLAAQSPDEQFARVAEAINAIEDPALRAQAAIDVFGRSGAELIPMMAGYRDAVRDAAEYQRQFGIAVNDVDAGKIDAIGDSLDRLAGTAKGVGTQLAVMFSDEIQAAIETASHSLEGWLIIFQKIKDATTTDDSERLAQSMDDVAASANQAADRSEELAFMLEDIADPAIVNGLQGQADAIRLMNDSFKAGMMTADEYKARIDGSIQKIKELIAKGADAGDVDMSAAISEMDGYAQSVGRALGALLGVVDAQQKAAITATGKTGGPGTGATLTPNAGAGLGGSGVSAGYSPPAVVNIGSAGAGGGGGGGRNLADELKALQESLATEAETIDAAYQEKLKKLEQFRQDKLITEQEYDELEKRAKQEHVDALAQIDGYRYGDGLQKAGLFFGAMATAFQNGNEKMQKTARVFGAAEALVNAWRAYTQTLADPSLPFLAKFAAGASVLSAGMAAVNAIRSGGGSVAGRSSSAVATSAASTSAAQSPLLVNLQTMGGGNSFGVSTISDLFDKLNAEAGDRGYRIVGFA